MPVVCQLRRGGQGVPTFTYLAAERVLCIYTRLLSDFWLRIRRGVKSWINSVTQARLYFLGSKLKILGNLPGKVRVKR